MTKEMGVVSSLFGDTCNFWQDQIIEPMFSAEFYKNSWEENGPLMVFPLAMGGAMIGMLGVATVVALPFMKAIDSARNEDGLINKAWQNFKEPFTSKGGMIEYIKDDHGYNGDIAGRVATVATLPLVAAANIPVSIIKATHDTAREAYDNYNKENYKEVATQTEVKNFSDKEVQISEKDNNESLNHAI
jgi:hypothetical protein